MPIGSFAAGPYTSSYTPSGAGGTTPATLNLAEEGWHARLRILEESIERSDAYGRCLLDAVFQGCRGVLTTTFIEWKAQNLLAAYPWAPVLPIAATKWIVVNSTYAMARLASDNAGSLTLTAVANTPAATYGPATATFGKIKAVSDQDIDFFFGPQHRKYSVNFDMLLYLSTSDYILYSAT